jgi:hypothetical protein
LLDGLSLLCVFLAFASFVTHPNDNPANGFIR